MAIDTAISFEVLTHHITKFYRGIKANANCLNWLHRYETYDEKQHKTDEPVLLIYELIRGRLCPDGSC